MATVFVRLVDSCQESLQVFFEKIFVTRPWKALFVTTDDSIKEWWFRWKIDRYSVASGMLFGFAHYLLRQYRVIGDNHHGNLFSRGLSLTVAFGALLGLGVRFTFCFMLSEDFIGYWNHLNFSCCHAHS
ncbi:hypothetical protein HPB51_019842 [Rhipicephalus microplus]|uniref:Cas1p 10 TM acyl transferase domain-containing protein n=1 Tax=Rhipicephalus microplus TaxID=6941 RepID=A0A9J6DBN0_RHIMP|nr:hypothetical protein HPB51_019842 [Rhipicephalus microplus]